MIDFGVSPAHRRALAKVPAASQNASRMPACSAMNPIVGGPTRNVAYPQMDTKLTRRSALVGWSAAAEMHAGNPSEIPMPHVSAAVRETETANAAQPAGNEA
jgi:hypothetical protein